MFRSDDANPHPVTQVQIWDGTPPPGDSEAAIQDASVAIYPDGSFEVYWQENATSISGVGGPGEQTVTTRIFRLC